MERKMVLSEHRDLFVGTVANELSKNGYLGADINMYGFLLYEDTGKVLEIEQDEEACVKKMLRYLRNGNQISQYCEVKKHIPNIKDTEDEIKFLKKGLYEKLLVQYDINNKEQDYITDKTSLLEAYFFMHKDLPAIVCADLVGWFYRKHLIPRTYLTKKQYLYQEANVEEQLCGNIAGFAWKKAEEDSIEVYSNAYLPNVWNRWIDYQKQGIICSGIYRQKQLSVVVSPMEAKEKCKEELRRVFQQDYFDLISNVNSKNRY